MPAECNLHSCSTTGQLLLNYLLPSNELCKAGRGQPVPPAPGTAESLSRQRTAGHAGSTPPKRVWRVPPGSAGLGSAAAGRGEVKRRPCAAAGRPPVLPGGGPSSPSRGRGRRREAAPLPNPTSTATYLWQAGAEAGAGAGAQPASGGAPGSGRGLAPGPAAPATETPSKAITKPVWGRRKGVVLVALAGSFSHPAQRNKNPTPFFFFLN